jgi:hypothetical protein
MYAQLTYGDRSLRGSDLQQGVLPVAGRIEALGLGPATATSTSAPTATPRNLRFTSATTYQGAPE